MTARWPRFSFYLVMIVAIALDQFSKAWATASLRPVGSMRIVPGFFSLSYGTNSGIAFGMFAGHGLLVGVFMVILAVVALYFVRGINWAGWDPNLVGGALCGGALSNLFDRVRLGYVVDFLDVYVGPHHWPTFNVADSLICISVGWIALRQLFSTPHKK